MKAKQKMKPLPNLSFRVLPELKGAIDNAAAADDRTVSSFVQKVLKDHLIENGFLKRSKPRVNKK
jgi:uncharacterized protein (DUF1778 family)